MPVPDFGRLGWVFLALFACDFLVQKAALAVRCFSCTVKPPSRRSNDTTVRLCSKFDGGAPFQVDCPLSTLCETRTFHLHTHTGSVAVTQRGCAKQNYRYQVFKDGAWTTVTHIEKLYSDGCFDVEKSRLRRHVTQYCYCSGDLCNAGESKLNDTGGHSSSHARPSLSQMTLPIVICSIVATRIY